MRPFDLHFTVPLALAVLLILGISALFSGCYTLSQGTIMLGYLGRAVPLESLSETGSEEERLFVQRVENIRRFAFDELGLGASRNYTSYVELDRDYLAAVVSASARDSFTTHQWWFPVVGRVPYKGFFRVIDAYNEQLKLERRDLDVWISRVDAFSTLGWFRDPLFSFMVDYDEYDLAELIIHELLHSTVFLTGHVQFNEELATFIGKEGARLYMEKNHGPLWEEETGITDNRTDFQTYHAFIRGLVDNLEELYNSSIPREEILLRKNEIIEAAKDDFRENYDENFLTDRYKAFSDLPINNAFLMMFRLYHEDDTYFNDLYQRSGMDLPGFIAAAVSLSDIRRLRRGRGNPREELERVLGL